MKSVLQFALLLIPFIAISQPQAGLVAYYDFDDDDGSIIDKTGVISHNGISTISTYDCGARDTSIRFNGIDEKVTIEGTQVLSTFETKDLTLSFYFKSLSTLGTQTQTLISKRDDCSNTNAFAIRYTPASNLINVVFTENAGISASLSAILDPDHCWHHIVLVRAGTQLRLIADGFEIAEANTPARVDLTTTGIPLTLGASSCLITDGPFEGFMDEVRIYDRALEELELETLYYRPDQIQNGFINVDIPKDTTIFLGNTVEAEITATCNDDVFWFPADGVNNTLIPDPVIEPLETTTYFLETTDQFGCVSLDSFRINVIDPADLECVAFLPNSFTPNDDGLNDLFGVDNPYALTDFVQLEIFDRWGNRVFFTSDPFIRWDGFYRATAVNPDIYVYKVQYRCDGNEEAQVGTVKIIR